MQQYGSSDTIKLLDIATFLDPRFEHYKDDDEKKREIEEFIKDKTLKIADINPPESEIQICDDDGQNGPAAKKSRLGWVKSARLVQYHPVTLAVVPLLTD